MSEDGFLVPHATLVRLGKGDVAAGRRLLRTLVDIEIVRKPVVGPTTKPLNVRLATVHDEQSLVELLRMDVRENAEHIAPADITTLFEFVQASTRDIHNLGAAKPLIGVIGAVGQVEAAIFLQFQKWFWSADTWFIEERLTTVHPDHRKSRHAADLLAFARWFVDEMSLQAGFRIYLIASVVGTQDVNRKVALFSRLMNKAGGVFVYPNAARP